MTESIKQIFNQELKRLNLKRYEVAKELGITYPALKAKIDNPDRFTYRELKKLAELEINLQLELYDTRIIEKDV
jgi:predicted transcriptional regulator